MSTPTNAVGLIRVSTAGQALEDRAGIPAQREAIHRLAAQYGLTIVKTFELVDVSGSRVLEHPDYQEFLRMLQRPDISAAVAKELSRFMRPERLEDHKIIDWFGDCNITLYLPDGPMDCAKRQDRFFASIRAGMAGLERQEIRDRMMGGKEAMRRQGRHPSAPSTLARGIGYDKKQGWHYKDELGVVRILFSAFLNGEHNYQRLASLTGIPRATVRNILTNPVYAGVMTYDQRHDLSAAGAYPQRPGKHVYRRKVERTGDDVIRFTLPLEPVITMEQHRLIVNVVEHLRMPRAQARDSAMPRFTYRGYLRCGSCDDLVYSWVGGRLKNGQPKDFYHCKSTSPRERSKRLASGLTLTCENRYMTRGKLEPQIDHLLSEKLTERAFLERAVDSWMDRAQQGSNLAHVQFLNERIEKLTAQEKRIKEGYTYGIFSAVEAQLRLSEVTNQIDEVLAALRKIKPVVVEPKLIYGAVTVFACWPHLKMEDKRRILVTTLPEIYVDRYAVKGVTLRVGGYSVNPPTTAGLVTTPQLAEFQDIYIPLEDGVRV